MSIALNNNFFLRNQGVSNAFDSNDFARHRWYYFKEGFSPLLVQKAISQEITSEDQLIIDPFCGSGTVPLAASMQNMRATGYEVNPFLAFVANSKLLNADPSKFDQALQKVYIGIKNRKKSALEGFSSFTKTKDTEKWLFNKDVLQSFEGGWGATYSIPSEIRRLLRLALIGAAMDNCNASKDGKCLRYKKEWFSLNYGIESFYSSFTDRVKVIKEDLLCQTVTKHVNIQYGDSRKLVNHSKSKFKLCVTSPPYLNSFDYTDVYRPELFLGKFIRSADQLYNLRGRTLRSHIQGVWDNPTKNEFGELYKDSIEKIKDRKEYLWNARIPMMVQAYFEDIEKILVGLKHRAMKDATVWIVVSTSAYAGVEIPVDMIIASIGEKVGWSLKEIGVLRHLRSAGQRWKNWDTELTHKPKLRESVVILSN